MTTLTTYHRNTDVTTLHGTVLELRGTNIDVVSNQFNFHAPIQVAIGGDMPMVGVLTKRAQQQSAAKAGIPWQFCERLASDYPELWERSLNTLHARDARLWRCSKRPNEDGSVTYVVRANLSDTYGVFDNVDVTTTFLQALAEAGLSAHQCEVQGDIDGDSGQLRMRVWVPEIAVHAHELVSNYRSPFDRRTGEELPMIFAGLELGNNETGGGAYYVAPRAVLQVCTNGMTRDVKGEAFRRVHLGSRLDQGVIEWSETTRRKQLEFMASAAKDAIAKFLTPNFLQTQVHEASRAAGIEVHDIQATIAKVTKQFQFTDAEAARALTLFTTSGDTSLLGVGHAVTALAQEAIESDRQAELERAFWTIVNDHSLATV